MTFSRIDHAVALTSIIAVAVAAGCAPVYDYSSDETNEEEDESSEARTDAAVGRPGTGPLDAATAQGGNGASSQKDAGVAAQADGRAAGPAPDGGAKPAAPDVNFSFFVTSDKSMTGDLGGLRGADERCQKLASAVGAGSRQWRAYLSVERDADNGNSPAHARDRIGTGPWYNVNGMLVAEDVEDLHARKGDADVFVDERGNKINGQWDPTVQPNEHDILTGSDANGRVLAGKTCEDWTSSASNLTAQVGHSDGFGPNRDTSMGRDSWHSAHANRGCNDTAPAGGAGRIYCFAAD